MKTVDETQAETALLTANKPKVRAKSRFGDDNHAAIDAQIRVLSERMTEEQVYEAFGSSDDQDEEQYVLDSALDALRWMTGEGGTEAPSSSWPIAA